MVSLLFLVSCTNSGSNGNLQSVYTGSQGVMINFVTNFPPAVLYASTGSSIAGQPPVIIEVKNKGAYDVSDGSLFLSGVDYNIVQMPALYNGLVAQSLGFLRGKTTGSPEGDLNQLQFNINQVNLPAGTDTFPVNMLATACYRYRTVGAFAACIDGNPYSTSQKACNSFGAVSTGGSQGAPVAISSVQQEPSQGRSIFKITLQNVGGGKVIPNPSSDGCLNPKYIEQDIVMVQAIKLAGIDYHLTSCSNIQPTGAVKLINNQATIVCKIEPIQGEARTVPLEVTLDYAYSNSIQKSIQIKRII